MRAATAEVALEAVLKRERLVFVAGMTVVVVTAWVWVLLGAGMEMSALEMTRMSGMDGGMMMQPAQWTPAYAVLMFCMWWTMMVAMMLPSASPMLLLYLAVNRKSSEPGTRVMAASLFGAGYLIAWGAFSLMAVLLQWLLERVELISPVLEITNVWLGAGILVAAGLWQLTPLKTVCLRHCRSPLGFLMGRWRAGNLGALRMGLEHGAYCLGCCWFLMTLLFFGGVMNLYWIAGLAVFVLLEKTVPYGHWLGRVTGITLVACGALLPVL